MATILLVDDEKILRTLLRVALEKESHKVLEAASAGRALSLARQHAGAIDLLITEIALAKKTGLELAETLEAKYPDMQSLFLARFSDNINLLADLKLAGRQIVKGPFDMGVMVEQVNLALADAGKGGQRKPPMRIEEVGVRKRRVRRPGST